MKNILALLMLCCLFLVGCVSTSEKLKLLSEESSKQEVREVLGRSYDVYYQAKDPDAKITEVWDYRFFPYKGKYDRFQKSLDRNVGIIGSFGVALLYPPTELDKETYRLYFKGDRLLKWEMLEGKPSENIQRNVPEKGSEEKNEQLTL